MPHVGISRLYMILLFHLCSCVRIFFFFKYLVPTTPFFSPFVPHIHCIISKLAGFGEREKTNNSLKGLSDEGT